MKYFEKHLKATDSADDIDISVHWDAKIFEWLMNYLNSAAPKLEVTQVIPILISADFLIMQRLIDEWVGFIAQNLSEVVKIPIDMGWLSQQIIMKIADSLTLEQLDAWKDPRDSLQSKLFSHKLDLLLKEDQNKLSRCIYWNILYTQEQNEWMTCPKADIFIDYRGRVLAKHVPDSNWDINEFLNFLRKNGLSWRRIFWKVWARLISDECKVCGNMFVLSELDNWCYHPEEPKFLYGANTGTYPCWEADAVRFSTNVQNSGCKTQRHHMKYLNEDSLEYTFLMKHYELLKEPHTKTSEPDINDIEASSIELSSKKSKDGTLKHKQMPLLVLLKEFVSNKYLKYRNNNWLKCAQMGTCCNTWLLDQDEDDPYEEFNFALPRNLKPSLQSMFEFISIDNPDL